MVPKCIPAVEFVLIQPVACLICFFSDRGIKEAKKAGEAIKERGYTFDAVYTSELMRAYRTANIIMEVAFGTDKTKWPPIYKSAKLIERHYGALTGKNKAEMVRDYGEEQVRFDNNTVRIQMQDTRIPD